MAQGTKKSVGEIGLQGHKGRKGKGLFYYFLGIAAAT